MQSLGHFFEQVSVRLQNPFDSLANLVHDVQNVTLDQEQPDEHTLEQLGSDVRTTENKQNRQSLTIDDAKQKDRTKNRKNTITMNQFFVKSIQSITLKQQKALEEVTKNLQEIEIEETLILGPQLNEPQIKVQKQEEQLTGEQLQKLNKKQNTQQQYLQDVNGHQVQQNSQLNNIDQNFSFANSQNQNIPQAPTKVQQAQQFCTQLRKSYFNQKVFTVPSIKCLIDQIVQTQKNNFYRCLQQSFQRIKSLYYIINLNNMAVSKSMRKNSSNRNLDSGMDFNLELTMRSKLSKQSGNNIDRQDSLVYSNATSFGLQNTQNPSKQVSRHNSLTKIYKSKDENQFDQIIHIEKTSSKGQVQNTQNQFSIKSLSDTEPLMKHPPKNSHSKKNINHSSDSRRSKSSKEMNPPSNNDFIADQDNQNVNQPFIKQEHDYEILPLTQQPQHISPYKKTYSNKKANINTFGIQTPQKPIKKSFSIKTYSNNKINNSRTTHKRAQESSSVFSAEISQLESRISKIKETKLLRKMKLEEELKKINNEIQYLKVQQEHQDNSHQTHVKNKSSHTGSKQKSAFESRIQINDDIEEKKRAANLIKNIRAERMSRDNLKRNQHKVLNADLHQQMQDMMRLKYFNEERVKQKRQLEIIERMKHQEMRKIVEQKQKQESIQFLSKLKHNGPVQRGDSKVSLAHEQKKAYESPVKNTYELPVKKAYESPVSVKKTEAREVNETQSNPALEKKKVYLKKMRNFTIIKKGKDDLYEHALN